MPVQACFLVGKWGLVVALAETYGRPSKKEDGGNFAHTVNIDGVVIYHESFQGSNPAAPEAPAERRRVP